MTHDPYVLLGVERTDSDAKIERALLRALERHDAPAKRAEARGAYRSIMAERGREPPAPGAAPDSLQGRKQSRDKGIVAAAPLAPPAGSDAAAPGRRGASAKDRRVAFGPDTESL